MPKTKTWQWYAEEFFETERHLHAIETMYFSGRTPYQSVGIIGTPVFGKMLVLDGDTQSAQLDERIYHEALVHPALAAGDRSDVLILGGGEGATLREVLRAPDVRRATMVDIDGEVVRLSKQYLPEWSEGAFDDPRADVIIGDALDFLANDGERYGVIISDLTEPLEDSPSHPLFCDDAFAAIKRHLRDGGIYVLQASTAGIHNLATHAKIYRTLKRHYARTASFFTHVPAFDNDWAFIACSDSVDLAALSEEKIETYCRALRGENVFYDAQTHRRIFALPLYVRRALAQEGETF